MQKKKENTTAKNNEGRHRPIYGAKKPINIGFTVFFMYILHKMSDNKIKKRGVPMETFTIIKLVKENKIIGYLQALDQLNELGEEFAITTHINEAIFFDMDDEAKGFIEANKGISAFDKATPQLQDIRYSIEEDKVLID